MNAENKSLQNLLELLNTYMAFETKTLDTIEGKMFNRPAKVIIRTKLLNHLRDGRWSQVQLWVSCGGESLFSWGCMGTDDEKIIRDWWYATRNEMDERDEAERATIKNDFINAQREVLNR